MSDTRADSHALVDDGTDVVLDGRAGAPAQGRELRARGKKTLARLLDAGRVVFDKRGYHAARVDDVVRVARTSHGTFYLYFSNKEDLFRALVIDVADEMTALAERLPDITPDTEGRAALRSWLDEFAALYDENGSVIRAWTESGPEAFEFGTLGIEVLGGFGELLADKVGSKVPAGVDPTIASMAFVAMTERFHYFWMTANLEFDRDAVLDTLARIIHDGFFAGAQA
ncbi:MAG TPA: TetR/AcrR family transcriptional regulator [Acidimicrobiales bacterium]